MNSNKIHDCYLENDSKVVQVVKKVYKVFVKLEENIEILHDFEKKVNNVVIGRVHSFIKRDIDYSLFTKIRIKERSYSLKKV